MVETVLVTGGTGYVASWCIAALLGEGYAVRATLRDPAKEGAVRASARAAGQSDAQLSCVVADLTADAGWDDAVAGCTYVLHVASPLGGAGGAGGVVDRDHFVAPARDGTLRVLRAAVKAGAKRVVMTSAAAAARPPLSQNVVSDETCWADPDDPQFDAYRRSKILAERAAWDFMRAEGRSTTFATVLPGAVFGPVLNRDGLGSVGIINGLMHGRPPRMPKLGFWIVDVRDLASVHVQAMRAPAAAGERFIAAGEFLWMDEIAGALREGLGERAGRVPTQTLPTVLAKALAPFMPPLRSLAPYLGRRNPLTAEKAKRLLGFAPRPARLTIVDCAESLAKT